MIFSPIYTFLTKTRSLEQHHTPFCNLNNLYCCKRTEVLIFQAKKLNLFQGVPHRPSSSFFKSPDSEIRIRQTIALNSNQILPPSTSPPLLTMGILHTFHLICQANPCSQQRQGQSLDQPEEGKANNHPPSPPLNKYKISFLDLVVFKSNLFPEMYKDGVISIF